MNWKKLDCGLWLSENGTLAFKTETKDVQGNLSNRFITELCCDGKTLNASIDTTTFKYLGSTFYKDKHHIYTHFTMADGGNFWILEAADATSFEVLGDCYAKDKNNIYDGRARILDGVDYDTFITIKGIGCYAKDKNGYYFWNELITEDQLNTPEIMGIIEQLRDL
ncbi:DKNYY domain-containing protein [Muriicola sp. Z0-33]|uniref:DKNYY domain-containing protein n=1 Tax=Muriicola sp. Z0-33 TaxID=2816957 RepID=UPI0022383F3C|nr:DKNYY domain-containing protein [Muriicola sp. Z0-33]MCW5516172.1 DKNYY domain-containing protein [Muriicola sp. Z0-33]